jgi:DNA-binding transcriptional MerR regulator
VPYTKEELVAVSGVSDRTIRRYMERGWVERSDGHGPGTLYDDEQLVRIVAIDRMRGEGLSLSDIDERIRGWTTARFKRFVAKTNPKPPEPAAASEAATPAEAPPPAPAPSLAPAAAQPAALAAPAAEPAVLVTPPAPPVAATTGIPPHADAPPHVHEPIEDLVLPPGPSVRFLPLLPGLGLALESDAPLVVQRIAAEIFHRYGRR